MDTFLASPSTPTKLGAHKRANALKLNYLNMSKSSSPSMDKGRGSRGGQFSPQKGENNSNSPNRNGPQSPYRGSYGGFESKKSPVSQRTPDRFIPNRSSLNLDYCNHEILRSSGNDENTGLSVGDTGKRASSQKTPTQLKFDGELYALSGSSPGKRLMSHFEQSPSSYGSPEKTLMRPLEVSNLSCYPSSPSSKAARPMRSLPSGPSRILDAPDLVDDYYLNLLSWGDNNIIAVALQKSVYLWHASDGSIDQLCTLDENDDDYVTSVEWCRESGQSNILSIGTAMSGIELWDVAAMKKIRTFQGHTARVSSLAWNGTTLTSGSRDSSILNHDMRSTRGSYSKFMGHQQEVCGLSWSPDGRVLASGGNENLLCLWDPASTQTQFDATSGDHLKPMYTFDQHQAAVKALAWCPFQRHTLASGGGTADRTIRMWNVANGTNTKTVDSGSQVCALQWNEQHKELLSSHGFSDNQLCLWKYPSMTKIKEFRGHTSRVLHLARSPDGSTIVSAGADETLRFWEIFGTPSPSSKTPFKRGMFSDQNTLSSSMGQGMLSLR
jgi:cell division cycle protein 20 (cofactor of APC complex)